MRLTIASTRLLVADRHFKVKRALRARNANQALQRRRSYSGGPAATTLSPRTVGSSSAWGQRKTTLILPGLLEYQKCSVLSDSLRPCPYAVRWIPFAITPRSLSMSATKADSSAHVECVSRTLSSIGTTHTVGIPVHTSRWNLDPGTSLSLCHCVRRGRNT